MTIRDLFRRTPFRLSAAFALFFTSTLLALFSVVYLEASSRFSNDIRDRIETTLDALAVLGDDKNFDDLVNVVNAEGESIREPGFIIELVDNGGNFLAGNVRGIVDSNQWLTLKRSELSFTLDTSGSGDEYLAKWRQLSRGRLLLGSNTEEVREVKSFLLRVLGYGLCVAVLAMLATAGYLAHQTQFRIDAFAKTLDKVSQGETGARVPITGLHDDIDQVALQVNGMLASLQRLIENVNQASSDIAHDLKKPLSRLRQRLDRTRHEAANTQRFRNAIDAALTDIDAITETFDALLRITQIEAGARKSRFIDVDLKSLLKDVEDVYDIVAEDAGDKLKFVVEKDAPSTVRGDPELLVQLFANLVENAIRHSPAGTNISLGLRGGRDRCIVDVADTGSGIPEQERTNVFRRLYRLERARSTDGSGLGLSLVAAIADLHGARVTLHDNAPGLRAEVEFPAVA
jgi:signal transduction histidine kinase